jgi:hypothetical protein
MSENLNVLAKFINSVEASQLSATMGEIGSELVCKQKTLHDLQCWYKHMFENIIILSSYQIKMSAAKNSSPSSVADVIMQGQGKRVDCEIQFKLLIKAKNNEITAKHPTLEGVLLEKNPIPFEPIPNIVNNDDVIERRKLVRNHGTHQKMVS